MEIQSLEPFVCREALESPSWLEACTTYLWFIDENFPKLAVRGSKSGSQDMI